VKFQNLSRGELIASAGGILLAVAVFVAWYGTKASNHNSNINGVHSGTFAAWDVHPILRWLMLAAAVAPLILAYIIVREHELSWPRGQVTSIVAIAALGLLFYTGIVGRPGDPSATISLKPGWFMAVIGAGLMLAGSFMRQAETEAVRKPPGVL
jgi:hypothetical protein